MTKLQEQYRNQLNRIKRNVKKLQEQGYTVNLEDVLPKKKRATKSTVAELRSIEMRNIRQHATRKVGDVEYSATEEFYTERKIKALARRKATPEEFERMWLGEKPRSRLPEGSIQRPKNVQWVDVIKDMGLQPQQITKGMKFRDARGRKPPYEEGATEAFYSPDPRLGGRPVYQKDGHFYIKIETEAPQVIGNAMSALQSLLPSEQYYKTSEIRNKKLTTWATQGVSNLRSINSMINRILATASEEEYQEILQRISDNIEEIDETLNALLYKYEEIRHNSPTNMGKLHYLITGKMLSSGDAIEISEGIELNEGEYIPEDEEYDE